jgi:signal transduction histidine kinase
MHPFVYSHAMALAADSLKPRGLTLMLGWRRVRFTLGISTLFGLVLSIGMEVSTLVVVARAMLVGLAAMLAFGLLEQWPRRLPRWLARSALQLVGITAAVPLGALLAYWITTGGHPQFAQDEKRVMGYAMLTFTGVLFAPWIAVGAMLRQRDAFARDQALAFELERTQLERNALDARLRLLQAQVEPHFLFNTLANVQTLVDAGSPQASRVLASLIAYLRAAVPRMHDPATTVGQELQLVRAYLELMQMRMPDRLQFALRIDPAAKSLRCPPMTLLTLVENAVRHGIDPSEEGGRIDVDVWLRDGRCCLRVSDTGIGLQATSDGLGTGLSTLRERLQLTFGGDAQLRLMEVEPHGVCAELDFPARQETT